MTHRLREKYVKNGWPVLDGEPLVTLAAIDAKVKAHFKPKHDLEGVDVWLSSAEMVLDGKDFWDDCDGLAYTCLDLAWAAGFDPHQLIRMMVAEGGGDTINHMVAGYEDERGKLWVFGDALGPVMSLDDSNNKLKKWARLDNREWYNHEG
jgi:hypothetical protein